MTSIKRLIQTPWRPVAYVALFAMIALPGLMISGMASKLIHGQKLDHAISLSSFTPSTVGGMPVVLSQRDAELYKEAFDAQRASDWKTADEAMRQTTNKVLRGHLLAERYLSRKYDTSSAELSRWLAAYADHPEAYEISQLERRKYNASRIQVSKPSLISMCGDDNGLAASFDESKHFQTWHSGIEAYRTGNYGKAAALFEKMIGDRENLSPWKVSGAGFWAWRSYTALGQKTKAAKALLVAASEPRSFYGILARQQLGQRLDVENEGLELNEDQQLRLSQYPAVIRATALVQAGKSELAERELRQLYSTIPAKDHYALLALTHQFSLPALQIAIAKRLENNTQRLDLAKYPIPEWEPVGGFSVDPALIYALVRQESGFRNGAISPAGAMGLMQLMPTTASMMTTKIGAFSINGATDAEKNITLGQGYVSHLLQNRLVDGNMIFMLAAYNAGIGRLQDWKTSIDYKGDPLLFIERMPYPETRYYVQQVMTNYWLYNEILGVQSPTLAALASNGWPVYIAAKDVS